MIAYDQTLQKYLTQDILLPKLKREIAKDFNDMDQLNQIVNHDKDNEISQEKQAMKEKN